MSHNVETMAFVGQVPWWGIGENLKPGDLIENRYQDMGDGVGRFLGEEGTKVTGVAMLKAAGLDWEVALHPLAVLFPENDDRGEEFADISSHRAVVRDSDRAVLGVVGKKYTPVQNAELFAVPDILVNEGLVTYHTAGSLQGGRLVWALLEMGGYSVIRLDGSKDKVERYLLWQASHDGQSSVVGGYTDVRVVCNNTLDWAMGKDGRNLTNRIRVRHTRSAQARIAEAHRVLMEMGREGQRATELYQELANKPMHSDEFASFAGEFLDEIQGEIEKPGENADADEVAEIQKRLNARQETIDELVYLFTDGTGNTGESAWDGFNSITEWLDHQNRRYRGASDEAKQANHLTSLLGGQKFRQKGRAVRLLTR